MQVYVIGRDYQATEIDAADAARRFMAWLANATNPVLAEVIQTWLWQPPDAGGLGALAESDGDVAALRASWSFPVEFQAAVERPSSWRLTNVKIVTDEKSTQFRALPCLAAWWFAVVRETVLASAGDRMQFMGVHRSSGQFSWSLNAQMNPDRHLLLSHSAMQSVRLRIPRNPQAPFRLPDCLGRIRVLSEDCRILAGAGADSVPVDSGALVHRCRLSPGPRSPRRRGW